MRTTISRGIFATAVGLVMAWLVLPLRTNAQGVLGPIHVEGGLVTGTPAWTWGVRLYRGIPYAAPPVGNLRWRPPEPAVTWSGVRVADHFSPRCMQIDDIASGNVGAFWDEPGSSAMSEDCLYLNVWTPAKSADEKLPVMFWIHGGNLVFGEGSEAVFDGAMLAKKGVIVVTFNYRLNVFSLLAHPELTAESKHHSSGDYGLLDQLAALRWVKNNIAQFGGDANNITIAGQSAGSRSVAYLMASPLAKGLFQRAIGQSRANFGRLPTLAEAEASGVKFVKAIGAPDLAALRNMPAEDLEASLAKTNPYPGEPNAIVDGWYLPEDVFAIFSSGKQNDVPLLTGSTNDERSSIGSPLSFGADVLRQIRQSPKTAADYHVWANAQFGDQAENFLKSYPANSDAALGKALHDFGRDAVLDTHWTWVQLQSKTGKSKSYLYLFSHVPPVPVTPGVMPPVIGAIHFADLIYVFNNLHMKDSPWTDVDRKVADITSSYWTNFMKSGDPNGPDLPQWSAFDPKDEKLMNLADSPHMEPVPDKAGVAFLSSFEDRLRQAGHAGSGIK